MGNSGSEQANGDGADHDRDKIARVRCVKRVFEEN